jgi:hypothetical protein
MRTSRIILAAGVAVLGAACAEGVTSANGGSIPLAAAFTSTPVGFTSVSSSFNGSPDTSATFHPGGRDGGRHDGGGRGGGFGGPGSRGGQCGANGLLEGHDFMGGGFGHDFMGGPLGGGRPFEHQGELQGNCTWDAGAGATTCTFAHDGLTATRVVQFLTSAGAAQQTRDSTTNTVKEHDTVTGTTTRRDNVTATVSHASDRTVTGLAAGSTQRTVNGTSAGTENLAGSDSLGAFTAVRVIGDTTTNVVIPIVAGRPSYPTSGTVVRAMSVSVTRSGTTTSSSRREVVTYNGTNQATLTITQDGTTKTCTLPLPHGSPQCQ